MAESLGLRNEVIANFRASSPVPDSVLTPLYFGLRNKTGRVDLTYPNCVDAISSYTDDCIFFSKLLIEDLVQHGRRLVGTFGKRGPKIHNPDWSKATQMNLIPDEKLYAEWLSAFKGAVPAEVGRSRFRALKGLFPLNLPTM